MPSTIASSCPSPPSGRIVEGESLVRPRGSLIYKNDKFYRVTTIRKVICGKSLPSEQKKSESLRTRITRLKEQCQAGCIMSPEGFLKLEAHHQKQNQELQKFKDAFRKYQDYKAEGHWSLRRSWNRNHHPEMFGLTQADADAWVKGSRGSHSSYLSDRIEVLDGSVRQTKFQIEDLKQQEQKAHERFEVLSTLEHCVLEEELKPLSGNIHERISEASHRLRVLEAKINRITYECAPKVRDDDLDKLLNEIRDNLEKVGAQLTCIHTFLRVSGSKLEKLDPYDFEFEPHYVALLEELAPSDQNGHLLSLEKVTLNDELEQKKIKHDEVVSARQQIRSHEEQELQKLDRIEGYGAVLSSPEILEIVMKYRAKVEALFQRPPERFAEALDQLRLEYFSAFPQYVSAAKQKLDMETGKSIALGIYLNPDRDLTEHDRVQIRNGSNRMLDAIGDTLEAQFGKDLNFRTPDLLKKIGAKEDPKGNFCCLEAFSGCGRVEYFSGRKFIITMKQGEILRDFLKARLKRLIGGSAAYLESKEDLETIQKMFAAK